MPGQEIRLLALDGGGVRGLSSLMILERVMEAVNPDAPPKPCDYFDMIGGTSTGGLIAIMLGRLKMSVGECIDAYLHLSDRVFQKKRHWITRKGNFQGRFDSEELKKAIIEVVQKQGLPENELLKDTSDGACKTFVCATSKETSEVVCLTSYKSPRGGSDLLNSVQIWEACRATSAASSFFDSIAIGKYEEEFVDGATGANNPVWELWSQAQLMWNLQPLDGRLKCLVSIGTGVPSLKPFQDNILQIGQTLVAIATETEQTAERFQRDKVDPSNTSWYYRFNVFRGLEDIGLEESKNKKEIAAATRRYVESQTVLKQIKTCANNISENEFLDFNEYQTPFTLNGAPVVKHFVDRPAEMAELERALIPQYRSQRQKIYVLHGLGGIGKTQLAVEFARRHHRKFSSVFWLDGRSEDSLKQSIASCVSRIPAGQGSETSRVYSAGSGEELNAAVEEVMLWLAQPNNTDWLLIFDNVDRDYAPQENDPQAYNIKGYIPSVDHGAVMITTRLAKLEQLGGSQQLGRVNRDQAEKMFQVWYKTKYDPADSERLFEKLDGLPLAIAQAGAYLQQSGVGVGIKKYLKFYDRQWKELMVSRSLTNAPLQDYPDRSIWMTWSISYAAVQKENANAANLLLLWAFLDNKDLWYGLFEEAYTFSGVVAAELSKWIGGMASNELDFIEAMGLLRSYSLVENVDNLASYATHPVVHKWAYHFQDEDSRAALIQLAVTLVGCAAPPFDTQNFHFEQRRLFPHAQICSQWVLADKLRLEGRTDSDYNTESDRLKSRVLLAAVGRLGRIYQRQDKLVEAEEIFHWLLRVTEQSFGPHDPLTLQTLDDLGSVYRRLGKLVEAEEAYIRVLQEGEKSSGPNSSATLRTMGELGVVHIEQGRLAEAEKMLEQALQGEEEALGPSHPNTLRTVGNLAITYFRQHKVAAVEGMYERTRRGMEKTLGPNHTSTLNSLYNLGMLYTTQNKLTKAAEMYDQTLRGYENSLSLENVERNYRALITMENRGGVYVRQGELVKGREMLSRALLGMQNIRGSSCEEHQRMKTKIELIDESLDKANTDNYSELNVAETLKIVHNEGVKNVEIQQTKNYR